jgi:hypothetical protein
LALVPGDDWEVASTAVTNGSLNASRKMNMRGSEWELIKISPTKSDFYPKLTNVTPNTNLPRSGSKRGATDPRHK